MVWWGLGALVVLGGGYAVLVVWALREDALLDADDAERGPEPHPVGRHRRDRSPR